MTLTRSKNPESRIFCYLKYFKFCENVHICTLLLLNLCINTNDFKTYLNNIFIAINFKIYMLVYVFNEANNRIIASANRVEPKFFVVGWLVYSESRLGGAHLPPFGISFSRKVLRRTVPSCCINRT